MGWGGELEVGGGLGGREWVGGWGVGWGWVDWERSVGFPGNR